jgi:hypothetical protein
LHQDEVPSIAIVNGIDAVMGTAVSQAVCDAFPPKIGSKIMRFEFAGSAPISKRFFGNSGPYEH